MTIGQKRVAVYVRVSTLHQTTENQLMELTDVCKRNDWLIADVYNETVSGTKSVDDRGELKRLMGVMASMENNIRKERQMIGIKRAKKEGVVFGRKCVVDNEMELKIVELRHKGKSIRQIAKNVGISVGKTHQVIKRC